MYIVISQDLTWKKKQFQQIVCVLKMHKHLEPTDLQIHEHEIPLHKT